MSVAYMTIEREYGSGGTAIARAASELSGVPCFGREILEMVSREKGISVEGIEQYEESARTSLFYSLYAMQEARSGQGDMLEQDGRVFVAEQMAIERIANENGRAILLGHCAAQALAGRSGVVRVFVTCSDREAKRERIMREYDVPAERVEATRRFYDRKRANYFKVNTGHGWRDPDNYDVTVDTANLDLGDCASMLAGLFD